MINILHYSTSPTLIMIMNQITVVFSCFENKYHSNTTYVCINYSKHALHMSEYSKHALLYNSSKYHGIFMLFLDMYNGNTMFLVIYAGKWCTV